MSHHQLLSAVVVVAEEMHQLGVKLSTHLRAGDLILVNGPLGAGKTVLAQGVGAGLGITGITSPTFVISRVHKAAVPFIHVDAYRLLDSENPNLYLDDLDLDIAGSITLIEWGGAEFARLSQDRLEITIDRSEDIRKVEITPVGPRWAGFSL
jgi:tRNA threonylcarbamoyladenosine biosynthesis protein TsaE